MQTDKLRDGTGESLAVEGAQRYEITSRPAAGQVFIGNQTRISATSPSWGDLYRLP